jgi:hypothetical protein
MDAHFHGHDNFLFKLSHYPTARSESGVSVIDRICHDHLSSIFFTCFFPPNDSREKNIHLTKRSRAIRELLGTVVN